MVCPKDKQPCNSRNIEGVDFTLCPVCEGVWIEQSEITQLVHKLAVPKHTAIDDVIEKWQITERVGTPPKDFWSEDTLVCPKGHGNMSKHYFAGGTTGVDQCQTCKGFWLDGGELKAIVTEVKPNPLQDQAWQALIKEENRFRKQNQEIAALPEKFGQYLRLLTQPPVFIAATVGLLLKTMIESVALYNPDVGDELGEYN